MKQIEITVKVNNTLNEVIEILTSKGFEISKSSKVEDEYLSQHSGEINKDNILDVLSKTILLRYLKEENREIKQLTHKSKTYVNGEVISEEKINLPCDDLDKARGLFNKLGFYTLVKVHYSVEQFKNDKINFALQNVEGLGFLLECEGDIDVTDLDYSQIINEKKKLIAEIKALGLNLGDDFSVKKAYELVLNGIGS